MYIYIYNVYIYNVYIYNVYIYIYNVYIYIMYIYIYNVYIIQSLYCVQKKLDCFRDAPPNIPNSSTSSKA